MIEDMQPSDVPNATPQLVTLGGVEMPVTAAEQLGLIEEPEAPEAEPEADIEPAIESATEPDLVTVDGLELTADMATQLGLEADPAPTKPEPTPATPSYAEIADKDERLSTLGEATRQMLERAELSGQRHPMIIQRVAAKLGMSVDEMEAHLDTVYTAQGGTQ